MMYQAWRRPGICWWGGVLVVVGWRMGRGGWFGGRWEVMIWGGEMYVAEDKEEDVEDRVGGAETALYPDYGGDDGG